MMNKSLKAKIKHYRKKADKIEFVLKKSPNEWGKFQSVFNFEVNNIFREIMLYEKDYIANGQEAKVYRLKRFFINKLRYLFVRGEYIDFSLRKPFGYAGDFQIIENIYRNNPKTNGFDRLFDNYFLMSAISIAVRNRKNDFKRMITEFVKRKRKRPLKIMNLASGPCYGIRELLMEDPKLFKSVIFHCYENDNNAIKFASSFLRDHKNIKFIKENASRIAFRKDIYSLINEKYDLIYSTGLFDYFEERFSIKLIRNLKKLLKPRGKLLISDVRDKYSNPSVHFMEWVGDWNLVYRDDDAFRNIFYNAGFKKKELYFGYEQQGILQYILTNG